MSMRENERVYTSSQSNGIISKIADFYAVRKRKEIFEKFFVGKINNRIENVLVLDVGATTDDRLESSNIWHKLLPENFKIDVLSDQQPHESANLGRVREWIIGSATDIQVKENYYQVVISNATLEHVGDNLNQLKMINEMFRVAREFVVISTPDRSHPFEFHSKLPLLHWLPKKYHRKLLTALGMPFLADERNLNLLTRKEVKAMIEFQNLIDWNIEIKHVRFFGFKSHIILIGLRVFH